MNTPTKMMLVPRDLVQQLAGDFKTGECAVPDRVNAMLELRQILEQEEPVRWGAPKTVGQMVQQLLHLPPETETRAMLRMPDFGPDNKFSKRVRTTPISTSWERVDGQWLTDFKGSEGRLIMAFWCHADTRDLNDRGEPVMVPEDQGTTTMGVGDGSGRLFVHGDYDSIKAMQAIVLERDQLRTDLDRMRALLESHQTCLASTRYLLDRYAPGNGWFHHIDKHINQVKAVLANQPLPEPPFVDYITQPGESLAGIAHRQLGSDKRWEEIRDINAGQFPDDYAFMQAHSYFPVGTVLKLPKRCSILKETNVTYSTSTAPVADDRPTGCCCPPKGHSGIWAAGPCPVHQGLRRLKT